MIVNASAVFNGAVSLTAAPIQYHRPTATLRARRTFPSPAFDVVRHASATFKAARTFTAAGFINGCVADPVERQMTRPYVDRVMCRPYVDRQMCRPTSE